MVDTSELDVESSTADVSKLNIHATDHLILSEPQEHANIVMFLQYNVFIFI